MRSPRNPNVEVLLEVGAVVDYEPCAVFVADTVEVAVCAGCGWLDDDHGRAVRTAA
jgi:hypothetical protein